MNEYEIAIKTLDGQSLKFTVLEESADMAAFWIKNESSEKWLEYPRGSKTQYIKKDAIVSFEVLDVKAREEQRNEQNAKNLEAVKNFTK